MDHKIYKLNIAYYNTIFKLKTWTCVYENRKIKNIYLFFWLDQFCFDNDLMNRVSIFFIIWDKIKYMFIQGNIVYQ